MSYVMNSAQSLGICTLLNDSSNTFDFNSITSKFDTNMTEIHVVIWWISFLFVLIACSISLREVGRHIHRNKNTRLRKYIVRILLMVPLYAFESLMGLRLPQSAIYWDTARDCYEAFVIFSFFRFLVEYLGGETAVTLILSEIPNQRHQFPFCCFPPFASSADFLRKTKWGTLQYVFIKLVTTTITLALSVGNVRLSLRPDSAFFWITAVNNVSQLWAIYCLFLLFCAAEDKLRSIRAVAKFVCVKSVVFFTYWQAVLILAMEQAGVFEGGKALSYGDSKTTAAALQDFIICIEMVGFAVSFRYAFPAEEFQGGGGFMELDRRRFIASFLQDANVIDVLSEVHVGSPYVQQMDENVRYSDAPSV